VTPLKITQRINVEARAGSGTQVMDLGAPSVSEGSTRCSVACVITGRPSFASVGA